MECSRCQDPATVLAMTGYVTQVWRKDKSEAKLERHYQYLCDKCLANVQQYGQLLNYMPVGEAKCQQELDTRTR